MNAPTAWKPRPETCHQALRKIDIVPAIKLLQSFGGSW